MAIMEVSLVQTYKQQNTINRWNYIASGAPAAVTYAFALASALGAIESAGVYPTTGLMWKIALVQNTQVHFDELFVRNVHDDTEFYSVPFVETLDGQVTGSEGMPPFCSFGFRTNRTRLDVRRGTKRFVGVSEGDQSAGTLDTTLVTGALANLASEMADILEYDDEGNTLSFAPVVCQKERYEVPDSDPARYAYRYYTDPAVQLAHTMQGILWEPYDTVRTQTSRQFGRGQ